MDEELREIRDHIAAELEFLYLLIFREDEAMRDGERPYWNRRAVSNGDFSTSTSVAGWPPFSATMRSNAQTGYYRQLADVTEEFVTQEVAQG